jgi:hypothetical protein
VWGDWHLYLGLALQLLCLPRHSGVAVGMRPKRLSASEVLLQQTVMADAQARVKLQPWKVPSCLSYRKYRMPGGWREARSGRGQRCPCDSDETE